MSWFKNHLNLTFFFAWLIANFLFCMGFVVTPSVTTDVPASVPDLSSNLQVYLDDNYTKLWDANNIPDLNNLTWSAPDNYGWQSSYLVVYAKNVGHDTIKVHVTSYQDLQHVPLTGYGASSDEILLKPNECKPLTIEISQSPTVRSFASTSSPNVTIYFHTYPTEDLTATSQGGGLTPAGIALFVLAAIILLGTEIWYLLQKRRSLFYLFLNLLNWIGFIILLCLENKAIDKSKMPE